MYAGVFVGILRTNKLLETKEKNNVPAAKKRLERRYSPINLAQFLHGKLVIEKLKICVCQRFMEE